MKNVLLAILSVVGLGIATAAFSAEQTVSMDVDKMTCALCPITIRKAMELVDGVQTVEVNFKSKKATVVFDDSKTSASEIAQASTDIGYPATPTSE